MLWERMNSLELKAAASDGLVAVLPVGSVETHGPHMPLGTDTLTIYMISERAAEIEPAVVLPPLCYAYVLENRHFPGTISLSARRCSSCSRRSATRWPGTASGRCS